MGGAFGIGGQFQRLRYGKHRYSVLVLNTSVASDARLQAAIISPTLEPWPSVLAGRPGATAVRPLTVDDGLRGSRGLRISHFGRSEILFFQRWRLQKEIPSQNPADKARYLNLAIEHYERGMKLDLNDYYPSCNLPRLLRERGLEGDGERALAAAHVARIACGRARERNPDDPWIKPTLLGAAFDAGDVYAARQLLEEISQGDIAQWMHETTLADLERSVHLIRDPGRQAGLREVLERLGALC